MDCIRVSQNVYDYLDGEVGRLRRQAIARHLETCAACSSGFQFEVQLRQTLWSKCRDEPPPELRSRILDALEGGAVRSPFEGRGSDPPFGPGA